MMRMRLAVIGWLVSAAVLAPTGPARGDAPQEAASLYKTAVSAYRTRQYRQAEGLLAKFVKTYPTNECVPVAYLQLATCRERLKDEEGFQQALDGVIKRFFGSPAWFCAYGAKLARAKALKDAEGYLATLEEMVRQAGEAPLDLGANIARTYSAYRYAEYHRRHFDPVAGRMGRILRKPGWIMDVVAVADTPQRAQRALRALAGTYRRYAGGLPTDWQYARVLLLRRAGKPDDAEAAFNAALAGWGDDPRAAGLWLLRMQDAERRGDLRAARAACAELISRFAGAGDLEEPLFHRLYALYGRDRFEEFVELGRYYLRTYPTSPWWGRVVKMWVTLARRKAEKGDTSRIDETVKMLDELVPKGHLVWQRENLRRKLDFCMLAKRYDQAVTIARELLGPRHWCAEHYEKVSACAAAHPCFAPVLADARKRWSIPSPDPNGEAAALLKQLQARLKDDQTRHAEEIGEEMFAKHRNDASTIEAVKALSDYYFKKVLHEARDKWMERMVRAYPYHPLTQKVLANRITALGATRRYAEQAEAIDTLLARFPGAADNWAWYSARLRCYDAAKDAEGKLAFVRKYYGQRARAGEYQAMYELAKYEDPTYPDSKARGDAWMQRARGFKGTRWELYCLGRAWRAYYWNPYFYRGRPEEVCWDEAAKVIDALRTQRLDPELRWEMAFADVNLLAHRGEGRAALELLNGRLEALTGTPSRKRPNPSARPPGRGTLRDLSLRLDLPALGSALGRARLGAEGLALAKRLKRLCRTSRDLGAIELMLAAMFSAYKNHAAAAEHYLAVVDQARWPARMYWYFLSAADGFQQAKSPRYATEMERYMRKVARVQELVPELLYRLGETALSARSLPALQRVRKRLADRYPASAARRRLEERIARLRR